MDRIRREYVTCAKCGMPTEVGSHHQEFCQGDYHDLVEALLRIRDKVSECRIGDLSADEAVGEISAQADMGLAKHGDANGWAL